MWIERNFLELEKGEKIILSLRRHWLIFIKTILFHLILLGIPVALYFIALPLNWFNNLAIFFQSFILLFASAYYLTICALFFSAWTNYQLDTWFVTNHRIIDINQNGLFHRLISWQRLERIQDVASETKGFWGTFFHFGYVYIQTAGEKARFIFAQIPYPEEVAREINLMTKDKNKNI